jgi:beta-glucosidase
MPIKELKAFQRVSIPHRQGQTFRLSIPAADLQKWDLATGKWKLYPGTYKVIVGSNSRDEKLTASFKVQNEPEVRRPKAHH